VSPRPGSGGLELDAGKYYTRFHPRLPAETLAGTGGTIAGPVGVSAGGTLAPGSTGTPLWHVDHHTTPWHSRATRWYQSAARAPSSKVVGLTGCDVSAALSRFTNVGGSLAAGNNFQIFPATTQSGEF